MTRSRLARCHGSLLSLLLAPALCAQWASLPQNALGALTGTNWYVAHDTGAGIAACSAIAQTFTPVAGPGSSIARIADACLIVRDGPGILRGWSAYSNDTATQAFAASFTFAGNSESYAAAIDLVPSTQGVLRAYSAFTNTWASVACSTFPSTSMLASANVAVQHEGLNYHAYSAYTGQWHTLTVPVDGGTPFVGSDYAAVDLRGTSGPRQYAAFSARRGTWTTSPIYPAAGAGQVANANGNSLAIRVDTGSASFVYAGYSPITGQWVQSTTTHTAASLVSTLAFKNVLRIEDSSPSARFEMFGTANGVWQTLTGSSLVEDSVHEDFHLVRTNSGSPTTLYAASGLVGGGYTSITLPNSSLGVSQGARCCIVTDGVGTARGYTAATNTFLPAVPQYPFSNVTQGSPGAVGGFTMQGAAAAGTNAQAFRARSGNWVAGPSILPTDSWSTYAGSSLLVAVKSTFPGYEFHVFDEHRNAWNAPVVLPTSPSSFSVFPHAMLYPGAAGTYHAYSGPRGAWSSQSGIGSIQTGGGIPTATQNLLWFTDSNNLIWVFSVLDRTHAWQSWPTGTAVATSGATPGGATPYFGVSMRGASPQFALLFGALDLAPSPLSVPGLLGALDLDPFGAVQLAAPGLFGSDGVLEARIPLAPTVPASTQLWLQLVTADLVTGQIEFAGRASGTRFF